MNPDGNGTITVLLACGASDALSGVDQVYTQHGMIRVVGLARDAGDALKSVLDAHPDVLVLDGEAAEFDALNTTLAVSAAVRGTGVVLLGGDESADFLRRAMKAGAKECLKADTDVDALASAVAEVAAIQRRIAPTDDKGGAPEEGGACRVIFVVGGKEGVGKTTIAVNLSVTLARTTGERVALVDLAYGDAAIMLNLSTQQGFGAVWAEHGEVDPATLRELLRQHESGVSVLPRLARLRYLEQEPIDPYAVQEVIGALRASFRYVVVDNPPLRTETELQGLSLADEILCVTTPWDILTLRNTRAFLDAAVGAFCPSERVRLILNRSDDQAMISRADVEKALQRTVSAYVPNDARLVATSINVGVPFAISKPESPIARAIRSLAGTLAGDGKKAPAVSRGFSLFRRSGR